MLLIFSLVRTLIIFLQLINNQLDEPLGKLLRDLRQNAFELILFAHSVETSVRHESFSQVIAQLEHLQTCHTAQFSLPLLVHLVVHKWHLADSSGHPSLMLQG